MSAHALRGLRAILLDFYGTLVDLNHGLRSAGFDRLTSTLGLRLRPGELFRQYLELIDRNRERTGGDPRFVSYRDSWKEAGDRLLSPYGIPDAGCRFAEAYADLHANANAFPEVSSVLAILRERFPVAVVANADHDFLMDCLGKNGLDVDEVVDSESMRSYKPDPTLFLEACQRLSVEPATCMMVGDTPGTDISGAQRIGMRAVWIRRVAARWPHELAPPDDIITDLSQLTTLCATDRDVRP